jgi:hypothetical protein
MKQDIENLTVQSVALLRRAARSWQPVGVLWPKTTLALPLALLLAEAWWEPAEWLVLRREKDEVGVSPESVRSRLGGGWQIRTLDLEAQGIARSCSQYGIRCVVAAEPAPRGLVRWIEPLASWNPQSIEAFTRQRLLRRNRDDTALKADVLERLRTLGYL